MGLFDAFKKNSAKQQTKQTPNNEAIKIAIQQTCSNLTQHCRDANLPYEITHKYQKGMIIREKGFVDATALSGGIITNHRYIILSNHMAPMLQFEGDKKWALCVANKDSRFLVLGKAEEKGKRVTVLLHLNDNTWQLFKSIDMSIFQNLLNDCYNSFKQCIDREPIPSVSTDEWLARCQFPVGMSDSGEFFPIDDFQNAHNANGIVYFKLTNGLILKIDRKNLTCYRFDFENKKWREDSVLFTEFEHGNLQGSEIVFEDNYENGEPFCYKK